MTDTRRQRRLDAIKLLGGRCHDCGNPFSDRPEVFDFDHMYDKTKAISKMITTASWERVLAELKKCELVCTNCHRTRTKQRRLFGCRLQ